MEGLGRSSVFGWLARELPIVRISKEMDRVVRAQWPLHLANYPLPVVSIVVPFFGLTSFILRILKR